MRRPARALAFALAALSVAAAVASCGSGEPAPAEGGDLSLLDAGAEQYVALVMRDTLFAPVRIEVRAGTLVAVALSNEGRLDHDFTLDRLPGAYGYRIEGVPPPGHDAAGYALRIAVAPGSAAELRLRTDRPGEYRFFCAVPGHRRAGMTGVLIVR